MLSRYLIFLFSVLTIQISMAQYTLAKQEKPKQKSKLGQFSSPNSSFSANNRTIKANAQKVDKLAEKIISTLELNDADAKAVHDLCEDRAQKIEIIKLNNDNSQQKIIDLQAVNQDFDAKIRNLVTANQYQKYEVMRRAGN